MLEIDEMKKWLEGGCSDAVRGEDMVERKVLERVGPGRRPVMNRNAEGA